MNGIWVRRTVICVSVLATPAAGCGNEASSELANVDAESGGWSAPQLGEAANLAEEIGSAALLATGEKDVILSGDDVDAKLKVHSIRKAVHRGALWNPCRSG
jgi:hypothetical protein